MMNTAGVTGGKPITAWLQYISVRDAFNPLVAIYDIHGRKTGAIQKSKRLESNRMKVVKQ
jgi:hypothetical protein